MGGAAFGALLGAPLLALMFLGRAARLPFAPFDLFALIVQVLPGAITNTGLELLVGALQATRLGPTADLAKTFEAALALTLFLALLAALGAWAHPALGLGLWLVLLPAGLLARWSLTAHLWIFLLCLGWGLALTRLTRHWNAPLDKSRRRFLAQLGTGLAALTVGGWVLGRWVGARRGDALPDGPRPATDGFAPVTGVRPELTPLPEFYQVAIKLDPPPLDLSTWSLGVAGTVAQPLTLIYADLTALPATDFYATLECISNRVGGDLISTTLFTGVALRDVLALAGPLPETIDIQFTCADGYTESLSLEAALNPDTRLCYAMSGVPLPPEHGYPLRLFVPNRFGMKNPKWITKITAVPDDYLGFWEQRRWTDIARVETTAVIDIAQIDEAGNLTAGGIAYAGARGISQVELKVDDSEWIPAELKPALAPLTWVLWRLALTVAPGPHRLTVRATDGDGQPQTARGAEPRPNGATGYHKITLRP